MLTLPTTTLLGTPKITHPRNPAKYQALDPTEPDRQYHAYVYQAMRVVMEQMGGRLYFITLDFTDEYAENLKSRKLEPISSVLQLLTDKLRHLNPKIHVVLEHKAFLHCHALVLCDGTEAQVRCALRKNGRKKILRAHSPVHVESKYGEQKLPIDIGSIHYMTKELDFDLHGFPTDTSRFATSGSIKKLARQLHLEAYQEQQRAA